MTDIPNQDWHWQKQEIMLHILNWKSTFFDR